MKIWLLAILLFCSATSAPAAETPAEALTALQQAIDTNNPELLEKYIDVSRIIASGVDAFIADYAAHAPADGDPLMDMLSGGLADASQTQASQSMKQMLVLETRKFVIRGVASGDFSGRPSRRADLPDGGVLAALFADASTARKELRAVRVQPAQGDVTTASAKVYDFGSERSYPVQLRLKRQPQGHWKVTDVTNLKDLVRTIRAEAG